MGSGRASESLKRRSGRFWSELRLTGDWEGSQSAFLLGVIIGRALTLFSMYHMQSSRHQTNSGTQVLKGVLGGYLKVGSLTTHSRPHVPSGGPQDRWQTERAPLHPVPPSISHSSTLGYYCLTSHCDWEVGIYNCDRCNVRLVRSVNPIPLL